VYDIGHGGVSGMGHEPEYGFDRDVLKVAHIAAIHLMKGGQVLRTTSVAAMILAAAGRTSPATLPWSFSAPGEQDTRCARHHTMRP
jgi:hypothetical protein